MYLNLDALREDGSQRLDDLRHRLRRDRSSNAHEPLQARDRTRDDLGVLGLTAEQDRREQHIIFRSAPATGSLTHCDASDPQRRRAGPS